MLKSKSLKKRREPRLRDVQEIPEEYQCRVHLEVRCGVSVNYQTAQVTAGLDVPWDVRKVKSGFEACAKELYSQIGARLPDAVETVLEHANESR